MFDIIVFGSATRDVFMQSSEFKTKEDQSSPSGRILDFPLGMKLSVDKLVLTTGGGGTNAAVTFARQGMDTCCIGVVGSDANGDAILRELEEEGVNVKYFDRHDDDLTAYSVILVQDTGERTILSYKGEGQHFSHTEVKFEELESKWVYCDSLGGSYELMLKIIEHSQKTGARLATNPGTKELLHGWDKLVPLMQAADIFSFNKEEAQELAGVKGREELFNKLRETIKGIVVVSDGNKGVTVLDTDGNSHTAGVPDSPVVERTGAGDAFGSGFVTEYMRSGDITKAIQFGTANASSVVTQFGAKAGILKKDDWGPWPLVEVVMA